MKKVQKKIASDLTDASQLTIAFDEDATGKVFNVSVNGTQYSLENVRAFQAAYVQAEKDGVATPYIDAALKLVASGNSGDHRRKSDLGSAMKAVGWVPSPKMRKVMNKLLADQENHIQELEQRGQFAAATWQRRLTWMLLLYMLVAYLPHRALSVFARTKSTM